LEKEKLMRNLVQELRDQGCKVSVTHYRNYWTLNHMRRPVKVCLPKHESPGLQYALPTGGKTVVEVTNPFNGKYLNTETICGKTEQFNKGLAVKVALGRLIKHIKDLD